MRPITLRMAIGLALLGTAACATPTGQRSALHWSSTPKRVFLEPAIYLSELDANGNEEQRPEWTETARGNVVKSIAEYLGERSIDLVVAPDVVPLPSYSEIQTDYGADYRLYFVQSRVYPRSGLTARNAARVAVNTIEVIGAIIGPFGGFFGGPATRDPMFLPIERGIIVGAAELFDTRTSAQVWRRDVNSVDLRDERSTRRMIVKVLHDVK